MCTKKQVIQNGIRRGKSIRKKITWGKNEWMTDSRKERKEVECHSGTYAYKWESKTCVETRKKEPMWRMRGETFIIKVKSVDKEGKCIGL